MEAMKSIFGVLNFLIVFLLSIFFSVNCKKEKDVNNKGLPQTNLLMIMFDDLRPELSIYGRSHMITPNFERLAKRSVIFDYAFAQVAVCNPSRDSLLTGLRPDTVGTYNFQHSFRPHLSIPSQLARSGYNTAGIGKLFHWDGQDKEIWNYFQWDNDWYDYQNKENNFMNSSAMPDKYRHESGFRDHQFAERAASVLTKISKEKPHFMLAIGFKLPHLALHVPYKQYLLYKDKAKQEAWHLTKRELRFPPSVSEVSYRCCADPEYRFMREEGSLRYNRSVRLGDINMAFTNEMRDELMMSYCAGVTFADQQMGKLLDVMDKLDLWKTTTVVLTADHGMHMGEKGIWEKWTLFDESTRVPLLIAHPLSPFDGQHYRDPVELVDVFPTVNDLLRAPYDEKKIYKDLTHILPQGRSLAPVILGKEAWEKYFPGRVDALRVPTPTLPNATDSSISVMPLIEKNFAITQSTRCAKKFRVAAVMPSGAATPVAAELGSSKSSKKLMRLAAWEDCSIDYKGKDEVSLLGYSMRTPDYRYTAYFHYNKTSILGTVQVDLDRLPYQQELFDHKNETLQDFTHRETLNLANKPAYSIVVNTLRTKLIHFIKSEVVFHKAK